MRMFGMGMQELIVIAVVALLVLGPDRLPAAARSLGEGIRSLRKQTKDLQSTIEKDTEIGAAVRELRGALRGDPATVYRRVTGENFIPPESATPVPKESTGATGEAQDEANKGGVSAEPADDTTASAEEPDVEATESDDSASPSETQDPEAPMETEQGSIPPRSTPQDS